MAKSTQGAGAVEPQVEAATGHSGAAPRPQLSLAEAIELLRSGAPGIAQWNAYREMGARVPSLAGANLRHCDLRGADLRETQITLPSLSGANLSGVQLPDERILDAPIKVVEEASKNCRTLFLGLLGACFYSMLVIAQTTDGNLLLDDKATELPIIQTPIPTVGFYYIAPLILSGFYIYFHLYLQRLWERISLLPAILPDGTTLDHAIYPWLLGGFVRHHSSQLSGHRPVHGRLQRLMSVFLAWWLMPVCVWYMWGRAVARHDPWLTGAHVVVLALISAYGVDAYRSACSTLSRIAAPRARSLALLPAVLLTALLGLLSYQPLFWWEDHGLSAAHGLPLSSAWGYYPFATDIRPDGGRGIKPGDGTALRASLRGKDLHGRHLRGADLERVDLTGADLSRAILVGADLTGAVLVETNLTAARLGDVTGLTRDQLEDACGSGSLEVTLVGSLKPRQWFSLKACRKELQAETRRTQREAKLAEEAAAAAEAAQAARLQALAKKKAQEARRVLALEEARRKAAVTAEAERKRRARLEAEERRRQRVEVVAPKAVFEPKTELGSGTLRINTRPWSRVYIDGRLIGNTPQMNIQLPAGKHVVTLKNPDMGFKKSLTVRIKAGQTVTKVVTLE